MASIPPRASGFVTIYDTNNGTYGQNPISDGAHVYRALQIGVNGLSSPLGGSIIVNIDSDGPPVSAAIPSV